MSPDPIRTATTDRAGSGPLQELPSALMSQGNNPSSRERAVALPRLLQRPYLGATAKKLGQEAQPKHGALRHP